MLLSPDERVAQACARLVAARYVLADLDGTLIFGDTAAYGARAVLAHFEDRVAVVSNYSTVTAVAMSARLAGMGLDIPAERIFLAGEVAVRQLALSQPGARMLCAMAAPMRDLAVELGFQLVEDEAEILLVGRDLDFSYARLAAAMRAVHQGAQVHTTNLDRSHPGTGALPVPETGALLSAITAAAPETAIRVAGKPDAQLFRSALAALGAHPAEVIMLGDNPDTDIAGANALGIASILIGSSANADTPSLAEIIPKHWQ